MPNSMNYKNPCFSAIFSLFLGLLGALPAAAWAASEEPDLEEMWRVIQEQQLEIENLKRQLREQQEITKTHHPEPAHSEDAHAHDKHAHDAHDAHGPEEHDPLSISGFGELHHTSLDDKNLADGDDSLSETDLHHFVLGFSYDFTDRIRFLSELELESATVSNEGESGELALEKAVVQYDVTDQHTFFAGADILPIGFLHIYHEPGTFYGVAHNSVETEIIPTTWTEGGAGFLGAVTQDLDYKLMVHSGLKSPFHDGVHPEGEEDAGEPILHAEALSPRAGRGQASLAQDRDIAWTGRLRWRGIPGLDAAVSGHYQSDMTGTADEHEVSATLFSGQFEYLHPTGLGLRALYARWDFDIPQGLSFPNDSLDGWYVEPSYRFRFPNSALPGEFGIFGRVIRWDGRASGQGHHHGEHHEEGEHEEHEGPLYLPYKAWQIGMNWWVHPNVVFKFDYQNQSGDERADTIWKGFSLGMGYEFGDDHDH